MLDWAIAAALGVRWLTVQDCPELDADRLVELMRLESADPPSTTHVVLRCDENAFVLEVQREGGAPAQRSIARTDAITDAPERYLAVELTELLDASKYKAPVTEPPPEPPPPKPAPPPPVRPPEPQRRGFVGIGARFEAGGAPMVPSGGGSLLLGGQVHPVLSLRVEVSALGGARSVGADALRSVGARASGAVLGTFDFTRAIVHIGGGARVGGVWLRGIPDSPTRRGHTHGGLTWSPLATASVLGKVGKRLGFYAGIDAGWALRPIRGFLADEVVASTGGAWIGVTLGLATRFGR